MFSSDGAQVLTLSRTLDRSKKPVTGRLIAQSWDSRTGQKLKTVSISEE